MHHIKLTCYSTEPRDISTKYSHKLLDDAKKCAIDTYKSAPKRVIKKKELQ